MDELKIYLTAPPARFREAALCGPVSAAAFRVGRDVRLLRVPGDIAGAELMDVDARVFRGWGPHQALAQALLRQCRLGGFRGMVLRLPRPNAPLYAFCALLDEAAARSGLRLYLGVSYARSAPHASLLIQAQNLSGTYRDRLGGILSLHGPGRVALAASCAAVDFPLPCRTGRGREARQESLPPALLARARFSPELCAKYASYKSAGRPHLVLWDDLYSLREKLRLAGETGVREVFVDFPRAAALAEGRAGLSGGVR